MHTIVTAVFWCILCFPVVGLVFVWEFEGVLGLFGLDLVGILTSLVGLAYFVRFAGFEFTLGLGGLILFRFGCLDFGGLVCLWRFGVLTGQLRCLTL